MRFHQPRSTTAPAAPPRGRPNARSSDASCVTSSARSTTCSDPPRTRPPQRVDNYRSVNALAEAFNSLFKAELIRDKGPWTSINDVEIAVAEYIDWFNQRRLHGELGHITPAKHEAAYHAIEPRTSLQKTS
ncbi:transposase [Streptomyces parvus]|uniref:Transposase n=1 Tax=Streptomyces parvus TaxID=66428 RepID=A0A5D4JEU1_9ACTN|nr:transposase [Streptomyces parvus]